MILNLKMTKAKYYIYRNLHKNCFSVRYKGKVIEHLDELYAYDVTFKVNEAGRQKVLATKTKNVHAFVVCSEYEYTNPNLHKWAKVLVRYNPYEAGHFFTEGGIIMKTHLLAKLKDGKIWV